MTPPSMTQGSQSPNERPNQTGAIVKRSVVIAGHQTSVSLEHAFWNALKQAAARRGVTINDLVTRIDSQRQGNLSSAIRVFLLEESLRGSAAATSTAA
ncbi:MAG TPA: ribbon-helix-helix domain-containing protein [Candidatus Sulfotelmatobacter sp.]|nr:ribbon-helix-helix domain-containing protein [Candidatus Sulfotelmatobacter sp.]